MADTHLLSAELRQLTGRKVNRLRSQGLIPSNVFGKGLESVSVQVSNREFTKLYDAVGETGLVNLKIEGQSDRPVLISEVEYDPITGHFLHVTFRQVNLKEKIVTAVPLEFVGEAPAVKELGAVLVQSLNEIEIEALPGEIPDSIQVDVSGLAAIGDTLSVGDLKLSEGIELITDPETVVALTQAVQEEAVEVAPEVPKEAETTVQKAGEEGASASAGTDRK